MALINVYKRTSMYEASCVITGEFKSAMMRVRHELNIQDVGRKNIAPLGVLWKANVLQSQF
jgi:hypothetical protein